MTSKKGESNPLEELLSEQKPKEQNVFIYSEIEKLDDFDFELDEEDDVTIKSIEDILQEEGIATENDLDDLDDFFNLSNDDEDIRKEEVNRPSTEEVISLTEFTEIEFEKPVEQEPENELLSIVGISKQAPDPIVNLRPKEFEDEEKEVQVYHEDLDFTDIIETEDVADMNIDSAVPFVTEVNDESDYILITSPLSNALADFFKNDNIVPEGDTAVAFELDGEHFIFRRINAEPKVLYLLQETLKAENLHRVKDDEVSQLSIYDYMEDCKFS